MKQTAEHPNVRMMEFCGFDHGNIPQAGYYVMIRYIHELKQKYEIKVKKQPCIRVTTTDQGEHMGISASAYEKWTKESLDLKDNEIYVVYRKRLVFG